MIVGQILGVLDRSSSLGFLDTLNLLTKHLLAAEYTATFFESAWLQITAKKPCFMFTSPARCNGYDLRLYGALLSSSRVMVIQTGK